MYSVIPIGNIGNEISASWVPLIIGHVLVFDFIEHDNIVGIGAASVVEL